MLPRGLRFVLAGLVALACLAPSGALAQCDEDEFSVQETAPSSGAADVPLNAYIRIRYPRCYFSLTGQDPLASVSVDLDGELVSGQVEQGDDQTIFFVPDELLFPNRQYDVVARDFEGDFAFSFRTAFGVDEQPPMFGEIGTVTSSRIAEPTAEAPEGGYRVDVSFDPATDDGAAGSIEYLLYVTRGLEGLEAPLLVARARNFATGLITMAFVLREEDAGEPICIVVHAVDGLGRIDDDQQPYCFEPIMGSFFAGCSLSQATPSGTGPWVLILTILLVYRRGRRELA